MVSFAVWKILSLIKSHLFIFFTFVSFSLGWDSSKKHTGMVYVKECAAYVFF